MTMERPNFPRWTILNFVEQLAEGTPMPGGGCAVSLAGALAAALGSLSGQISLRKEGDPARREDLQALQPELDRARETFLELIDADALAYQEVVLARRLPAASEEEKAERSRAIAQAFAKACEPPLEMTRLGLQVLDWAMQLGRGGSPVILADVGVMGFLAIAVAHGGLINIFSNLTMMAAGPESTARRATADGLREVVEQRSREFGALIYRQVGGGAGPRAVVGDSRRA